MKLRHKFYALVAALLMTLALGLAACGEEQVKEKRFSVKAEFDATQGSVILSGESAGADGTYAENASVTVTVTPNADYEVETFTVNGAQQSLSADGKYTFTVKEDTTVKATFALKPPQTFSVTLVKQFTEEMGTASLSAPKNGEKYEKDELVTLTVSVNSGYVLESVTVGGESVELDGGGYSFRVKADVEVTVAMRAIAYYGVTVSVSDENMGTAEVTPEPGADGKYREHTEVTLTVKAKSDYKLVSVKVDGEAKELTPEGTYSFTVEKDTQIEVTFAELEEFNVSVKLDEKMCDVTYIGSDKQATSLKEGGTFRENTELALTVVLNGGYKLKSVTVNGTPATMTGNGFIVTVTGDLKIVIECEWDVTSLTSLAGEYALKDDKWYTFTLAEGTVFEFSADNYMAYAAVYKVAQVAEPGKDDKPVWSFFNTDHAFHAFEAGTYVARLSSNTGDGTLETTLTVSYISPVLAVSFPEAFRGNWKSTDDAYTLLLDENWLILKDKSGSTVTTAVQSDGDSYTITVGGSQYELMPYGVEGTLGFFQKGAATPQTLFLPDPLPEFVVPAALFGDYEDAKGGSDDLSLSTNGIKWGEKELILLSELPYGKDPQVKEVSAGVYYDGDTDEVYQLTAKEAGKHPVITLSNSTGTYQFTYKEEQPPMTFSSEYLGTWVGTGTLSGYRFVIEEHNITITKDGQPVETTLGQYESKSGFFPTFTLDGVEYYLGTVVRGSITVSAVANGKFFGTITARWTITVQAEHANVAIENQQNEYVNNAKITFTVTAETGYTVSAVKQNGKALTAGTDGKYSFYITANTVITVECEPAPATAAALPFAENFIGEWKNADLYLKLEQNSVTLTGADGSALAYTVGTAKYGSQRYNSVKLYGATYVFLKAEGT